MFLFPLKDVAYKGLRPRQYGRQTTLPNVSPGKKCIIIQISLKCVPKGPINNMLSFIQVMAWCWLGTTPLSELMVA